jgi:hypothetical protein
MGTPANLLYEKDVRKLQIRYESQLLFSEVNVNFRFLLLSVALVFQSAFASAASLDEVFSSSYYTHYEAGRCGGNIMALVTRANEARIDVSRAKILQIRNEGFSVFGMLNAEHARDKGRVLAQTTPQGLRFAPGETNWDFHVVLELDGEIYDFDFGNSPSIAAVDDYFETMFLNDRTKEQGGKFPVEPNAKLKDYRVTVLSAQDYLRGVKNPKETKLTLAEYLKR